MVHVTVYVCVGVWFRVSAWACGRVGVWVWVCLNVSCVFVFFEKKSFYFSFSFFFEKFKKLESLKSF